MLVLSLVGVIKSTIDNPIATMNRRLTGNWQPPCIQDTTPVPLAFVRISLDSRVINLIVSIYGGVRVPSIRRDHEALGLDPLQASRTGQDAHRRTTKRARAFFLFKTVPSLVFRFPEVPEVSPELTIYLFGVVLSVVGKSVDRYVLHTLLKSHKYGQPSCFFPKT
jgi:hypothetical protein